MALDKVNSEFVLSAVDATAKAFNSVNQRIKETADNTETIAKVSKVGFALFVGGELLEGVRKLAGAMFDVKNATNKIDAQRLQGMHNSMEKAREAFVGVAAAVGSKLAPMLEMAADWFVKLIGDGEAFREGLTTAFEWLTRGVGVFADAWRGIEVIWAGLQLAFHGFRLAVITGLQEIDEVLVDVANKLPGVQLQYSAGLKEMAESARGSVDETKEKLHDLMMKPLPSGMMKSALAQFDQMKGAAVELTKEQQKARDEAAKALAKERERQDKEMDDLVDASFQKIQKENEQLAASIEVMRKAGLSKLQVLEEQHAAEQASIQSARLRGLTDEETARQLELESLARFNEQKAALQQQADEAAQAARLKDYSQAQWLQSALRASEQTGWRGRFGIAQSFMGQMSTLMQSHSRRAFEVGKILAISNATIDGISATLGAFKVGARIGGPVLGASFAAAAASAALVQIQALNRQQFGGGGAANVGASAVMPVDSTGTAAASPIREAPMLPQSSQSGGPERQTIVKVDTGGNAMLDTWIRERLAPAMREAHGDGIQFFTV